MGEVIELTKIKRPEFIINNEIDDSKIMFPEKLKEVNEFFEKNPLPAELYIKTFSKAQREDGFCVSGVLKRANAHACTFLVMEMQGPYEIHFNILTTPEILNKLVKTYWEETINVRILPQINSQNKFEYALMEVN